MRRKKRMLDVVKGTPGGLGDWYCCGSCGSLISLDLWTDDGTPCPACGDIGPIPEKLLDRIARLCNDCITGQWGCSAKDLAELILDECPEADAP